MRGVITSTLHALGNAVLWIVFAAEALLIVISDGRVLDLSIGFDLNRPSLLIFSLSCWLVLAIITAKFVIGSWRKYLRLKRSLLSGVLLLLALLAIDALMPRDSLEIVRLLMVAVATGFAVLVSERIVPRESAE